MTAPARHLHLVNTDTGEASDRFCETCGALIPRHGPNGDRIRPNKYRARRFCSKGCVRRGPQRPPKLNPNPTPKTGRLRAQRMYQLRDCDRCGAPGLDRHHIDGDTSNNEQSNIAILCRRCHMEVDGRLERLIARQSQPRPIQPPKPCAECGTPAKPLRRGMCNRCYLRQRARAA